MVNYVILITGSRDWDNAQTIKDALMMQVVAATKDREITMPHQIVLHSGACPTGADKICEEVAESLGFTVYRYPANWKKYGKSAGFRRNQQMVDLGANICIAFIKNESKGATMTARIAEESGIPTVRYTE